MKFMAIIPVLAVFAGASAASAEALQLASPEYVRNMIAKRVDTSESADQTLKGTYVVEGKIEVPTPALPSAD